jgi:hypothetical protein
VLYPIKAGDHRIAADCVELTPFVGTRVERDPSCRLTNILYLELGISIRRSWLSAETHPLAQRIAPFLYRN